MDPALVAKMSKVVSLSEAIQRAREAFNGAPSADKALDVQRLLNQRRELWALLPPLRLIVDNT